MHRTVRTQILAGVNGSGVLSMFLSVLFYVAGDLLIKGRLDGLPSNEVVFFRNLFGLAFLLAVPSRKPLVLFGPRFGLLVSRGVLGYLSLSLFYYLLMHAPMANAVVFLQSSTIFAAIAAFLVSRERLTAMQSAAAVAGFGGIWLIVNPHLGASGYDLLGVALGVVFALANTSIKELKEHYDSRSIVFSYLLVGIALPVLMSAAGHLFGMASVEFLSAPFVWPKFAMLPFLIGLAVFTTLAQLFKTKAYALDKAGVIGTIGYSRIVFAIAGGVMLGDGLPGGRVLAGIALVTASAIIVSFKDK